MKRNALCADANRKWKTRLWGVCSFLSEQIQPRSHGYYRKCQTATAARQSRELPVFGRQGAPLGQRVGSSLFVNLASDEIALLNDAVVDLSMNSAEFFRRLHISIPLFGVQH